MKEQISDYMRIGLVHFMAYPDTIKGEGPVLQTIKEIAKDDYFEIIEHTWIKDEKVREDARNMIKSAGLTNTFGGQPLLLTTKLNINDLDDGERQKAVCLLKEGIDENDQRRTEHRIVPENVCRTGKVPRMAAFPAFGRNH